MIRLIIRDTHYGAAANVGGDVETRLKTFDVELPAEIEAYLREFTDERDKLLAENKNRWWNREVIGVEVLPNIAVTDGAERHSVD
jgi:hypothetical protein